MFFKEKRIFISGGAGVIGTELAKRLYESNAILFVGDLKPKPKDWPDNIIYCQGDLNYIKKEEILGFEPHYFFHLAATFERSVETYDFWEENYHHNIRLSNYLMTILKECKSLKKVIFASSYLIYDPKLYLFDEPQKKAVRLKETDPIMPRNLTGASKLFHELELEFLRQFDETKFKVVSARIFRSYGKNSRDVISRWIRDIIDNKPITVYAKEGKFDYIYAGEVAEGLIKIAQSDFEGIINLGNDNARSVSEVLEILRKNLGNIKIHEISSNIPFEASQASMDEFYKVAGWKPSKQLEDAIPEIISFEREKRLLNSYKKDFNILITSVSKKVPLIQAVKKASKKFGNNGLIYGADIDERCVGAFFVDKFWKMPRISDIGYQDVIDYCLKNNIKAIIPTRDGELEFFAENNSFFNEAGINVMISPLKTVRICIDKFLFFNALKELGLPVVETSDNCDEINSNNIVVKERFGAGAKKIGLNLSKEEAKKHAKNLESPIFQPFIEGDEISVDFYVDKKGRLKGVVPRVRFLVENGESQVTYSIFDDKIDEIISKIVEKIEFYGHIILQIIKDNSNRYHIIECNCRFGGASTLGIAAGLDSFYYFLSETLGVDIESYPFLRDARIIKQVRYPEDIIIYDNSF